MADKEVEIILREDGFYQVKMLFEKERFADLLREGAYHRDSLSNYVTQEFAKVFVQKNFDDLSKLIDLETVKLLATRRVVGAVAGDGG